MTIRSVKGGREDAARKESISVLAILWRGAYGAGVDCRDDPGAVPYLPLTLARVGWKGLKRPEL
jgi:hypothetical protein